MVFIDSALTLGCLAALSIVCFFIFKRKDIADVFWGMGFFVLTLTGYIQGSRTTLGLILLILVSLWAFRLSSHILIRNLSRKEDFRYTKWTKKSEIVLKVFILQPLILYIVALPILWAMSHEVCEFNPLFVGSIIFWISGFTLESIADYQLYKFKKSKDQNLCLKQGVWSYCRHPNHLGEIMQWWALWSMTLGVKFSFIFVISPLLLTALIIWVSGVAPLEEKLQTYKDFEDYTKKVPRLFPSSFINGLIFTLSWYSLVFYGFSSSWSIPFLIFLTAFILNTLVFYLKDVKSFYLSFFLILYGVFFGLVMEVVFVKVGLIEYKIQQFIIPVTLLYLYSLFGSSMNSSLDFLNKNLLITYAVSSVGAGLSYLYAERLGDAKFGNAYALFWISAVWGGYGTILAMINRKLVSVFKRYENPKTILTVIFDKKCPICNFEMHLIQKKGSSKIVCQSPINQAELEKITHQFTYDQAMKKIYAFDHNQTYCATEALSQMYARSRALFLAILLQAPFFKTFFNIIYKIWAVIRPRK